MLLRPPYVPVHADKFALTSTFVSRRGNQQYVFVSCHLQAWRVHLAVQVFMLSMKGLQCHVYPPRKVERELFRRHEG